MVGRAVRLRELPSIDRLLHEPAGAVLLQRYSRRLVKETLRSVVKGIRERLSQNDVGGIPDAEAILAEAEAELRACGMPSLRRVVNASGVVLHTNLGRAALADEAIRALASAARETVNLEYDVAQGRRGERDDHVDALLRALTGAEAATVVNNNAAAVLLALNTLADGREVIVSRGELVEIGGAFRMPEIIAKSGARLREVGTTNRTHRRDFESALGAQTALLLKVHTSNYRVVGFTAEVELKDLVRLGRSHRLPVMEDLGSGALVDLRAFGLPAEPVVAASLERGADLVTFSGDKLLGGPQAGLVVGRRDLVEAMRRNPLKRALRCDKMTLAALEATLRLYRAAPDVAAAIPVLRLLVRPLEEVAAVARAAVPLLREALGPEYGVSVVAAESEVGSGALPTATLPSKAVAVTHPSLGPLDLAARFRAADPPVIGRVHGGRFLLDMRCIGRPEDVVPGGASEPTGNAGRPVSDP